MRFIADLEIHSKYARAVSREMTLENIALGAAKKGVLVVGTGDFTHPLWLKDIKEKLEPAEPGLFRLKKEFSLKPDSAFDSLGTRFLLSGEVSCIYSKNGRVRRVHHLIYAPDLETVNKINTKLSWIGNLKADGRPILGLDSKELLKIVLESSPDAVLIPAHVWTPWFGIFGSKSGFDSIEECFEELTPHIFAIETGLSSDPDMNWRIPFLDGKAIMSSSDPHSLKNIGREACVFDCEPNYYEIFSAFRNNDLKKFISTLEFYPEEGRYHLDGHAQCKVVFSPDESKKHKNICPVCSRPLTIGVMNRVEELAGRPSGFKPADARPFTHLIALEKIIGEALDLGATTKGVSVIYKEMLNNFGPEIKIITETPESELKLIAQPLVTEAIKRVREGKVGFEPPGYDGEYGRIKIFTADEREMASKQVSLL